MFWKVVTIQLKALLAVKLLHLLVFHEVLFLGDLLLRSPCETLRAESTQVVVENRAFAIVFKATAARTAVSALQMAFQTDRRTTPD